MKSANSANGVRLIVLIALSAALALGSFWLVEVMQRKTEDALPARARTEPDFYVEKFNFVRMGKTGEARYNLTGTEMKHYPQDDSYQIQNPVMHSYSADKPPMVSRSLRATISNNSSEVHMYDNVHIDRPASTTSRHFQLKTSYLLLLPDDDVMKTPKPVEITIGESVLTGAGMFANNASGEFRLSSNVKGQYQPPNITR
ncbi:LPS export ABC transporter periplasmic protein LptC [Herminiimonas sp. NPDC097707]|uniref:LPS export ABC transporter periplasmic protein LptC n=1 Tax=Herminiimonas sp. NPDC097707 TaxID=3364007 RepID=UPI00383B2AB6